MPPYQIPLDALLGFIYVYDPSIDDYLEVPAVESWATYATGKSLWQHRVVRRQALRNGDRADAASLGMAERRIWSIVKAASITKTRHGTKVSRFKAGGAPLSELESGLKPKPNTGPRLISPADTVAPPPLPPISDSQPIQTLPRLASERAVPDPNIARPLSLASEPTPGPTTADDFLTLDVDDDGWEVGTRQTPNSW